MNRTIPTRTTFLALAAGAAVSATASAQVFLLDDILNTAEDPYAIGLPATIMGWVGPSPSMIAFGYMPGLPLGPFIGPGLPPHLMPPNGGFVDALSADKPPGDPFVVTLGYMEYSVDRDTTGLPGMPLAAEAAFFQQMGDIYLTQAPVPHPALFVGKLTPGIIPNVPTFGGVLPSAGAGGPHRLLFDESAFGMTDVGIPGVLTPPGVPTPPPAPGNKDNLNSWNRDLMDFNGDMISDINFFFSVSPNEAVMVGVSPADIFDVAAGAPATNPIPYAPAPSMGLDWFGFQSDDIDALVLWDNGIPLGPNWGGPGGEPLIDYALFSLSPGSQMLFALVQFGLPVTPGTVFFTDFTGSFGVYAFETDLGVAPMDMFGGPFANIDALDFVPICRADMDANGVLNIFDFLAFQTAYGNGNMGADFTGDGFLNIFDFLLFQTEYSNGC